MGDRDLRTLVEGGAYFEGPRWHDGRWWVSDFYRHAVIAVGTDGKEETILEVEGQPSGLGWMPDGSLLVVSMREHALLRRAPDGWPATSSTCSSAPSGVIANTPCR